MKAILELDMPEFCRQCPLFRHESNTCKGCCPPRFLTGADTYTKKADFCPLIIKPIDPWEVSK